MDSLKHELQDNEASPVIAPDEAVTEKTTDAQQAVEGAEPTAKKVRKRKRKAGAVEAPQGHGISQVRGRPDLRRVLSGRRIKLQEGQTVEDLPPDYQAEIRGAKKAARTRRKQSNENLLPMVWQNVTLHCPELQRLFVEIFESCNEYAAALESSARLRIGALEELGRFDDIMDGHVEQLLKYAEEQSGHLEEQSKGGKADSPKPMMMKVRVQSRRSNMILVAFNILDDAARHASYLTIYGHMKKDGYQSTISGMVGQLTRTARGLQKVKRDCFAMIKKQEELRNPGHTIIGASSDGHGRRVSRSRQAEAVMGRASGLQLDDDEAEA